MIDAKRRLDLSSGPSRTSYSLPVLEKSGIARISRLPVTIRILRESVLRRIRNLMVPGVEGGVTRHQPSGEGIAIYEAADRYRVEGVPLVVSAGRDYGTGSSRDWAAKGTRLLGVRAVVARGFERIHRSNLIDLGVLPCQLPQDVGAQVLGLDGTERFDLTRRRS